MIATALFVLVLLLALGFPMMVPLLAATLVIIGSLALGPAVVAQQMIGGVQPSVLVAVPLFIFAANVMTAGQTADRLVSLAMSLVGHVRGGLPIATATACTLFGGVSGSTQATVVAIGKPMRARLLERGYPDAFAIALIVNASDIALLIPPSIGMIVYGVVSGTSVGELFLAGIGPGILVLALISAYCWRVSPRFGVARIPKATARERLAALRAAAFPLGFPVIVVGGIYAGITSPTEAAAISVAYAVALEVGVFRTLRWNDLPRLARDSGLITAVVFVLVGAGAAFSWTISFARVPEQILGPLLANLSASPIELLAVLSASYFVGCMFVDPIVVILVLTPIFAPAIHASGIDPVLAGTLVTLQVAIGSATPPFGCDLFTAVAVFRRPYLEVVRGTPPFLGLLLVATALIIAFPPIALALRDWAMR